MKNRLLLPLLTYLFAASASAMTVENLRCNYQVNPDGIDTEKPQLNWWLQSEARGERQTAYRIIVASSAEALAKDRADAWDSGKVMSDQNAYVNYAGSPLQSGRKYWWKVRAWDKDNAPSAWSRAAHWSVGLLKPEDWRGKWISASRWFTPKEFRPLGFITMGTIDPARPAWADVDLGKPTRIDEVKLYANEAKSFPLRFRIEASDETDFDHPTVIADCSGADYPLPASGVAEFPGNGGIARHVRLFIVRSPEIMPGANPYQLGSPKISPGTKLYQSVVRQMQVFSGGTNVALYRRVREFGTGWAGGHASFLFDGMPSANDGDSCPDDALSTEAAPLLRKAFTLDRPVKRAMMYYAAMGMADVTVNGQKTGDDVLGPPFTDYSKRVTYLTKDITPLLSTGENVIGAVLGNGFFSPPGLGQAQHFGGHGPPRFLAQVQVEFADGTQKTISTDETWKWVRSEITFNDLWDKTGKWPRSEMKFSANWSGYTEDRRLAKPGWDRPGFSDADWRPVGLLPSLGGMMCAQTRPAARVVGELKPVRVEGSHAFFDVIECGWPRLKVRGKAGQTIKFYGSTFTLARDGETVLEPRFIWQPGETDLKVEGLTGPLKADDITMQVAHADLQPAGTFHCSNPWLNTLHEALLRTHLNYNLHLPIDPMREKQAWTQDAQNMFDSAAYLTDVAGLYRDWWWDMADDQEEGGLLGSVMPLVGMHSNDWNTTWWSGVIVWLPWQHYLYYGDRRVLEDAYEPMRRYVDFLDHIAGLGAGTNPMEYPDTHYNLDPAAAKDHLLIWGGAGDWNAPYDGTPVPLMTMPAWYYYATVVSNTARLLGKQDDAAKYAAMAEGIRDRFNTEFFHPETGLYGDKRDSQTAQVMPLALGMVPADKSGETLARLIDAIHAHGDHVGSGFVGLPYLMQVLTNSNETSLANVMVNQQSYPSWKTAIQSGVFFEGWKGTGVLMPSCGGAIGMWLYQSVLGIRPDPAGPGFKKFLIAPQPDPATGLTSAEGSYDSVYGRIVSKWKIGNGQMTLEVTVPSNTSATVRIPTTDPQKVNESGEPVSKTPEVKVLRFEPTALTLEIHSGHYRFVAPWRETPLQQNK